MVKTKIEITKTKMAKIGKVKFLILALLLIVLIVAGVIIYRMFFKFKRSTVQLLAQTAANTTVNPAAAYSIIMDMAQTIQASPHLTEAVMASANAGATSPEQELVNTSLAMAYSYGLLVSGANPVVLDTTPQPTT